MKISPPAAIYACFTPAHVLKALVLSAAAPSDNCAFLIGDRFPRADRLVRHIREQADWVDACIAVKDARHSPLAQIGAFQKIFYNGLIAYADTMLTVAAITRRHGHYRVFLGNDAMILSRCLLLSIQGKFSLMEDGFFNYQTLLPGRFSRFLQLAGIHPPAGRHPKISEILVRYPEKLPSDIRGKGKRFICKEAFNLVDRRKQEKIKAIFPLSQPAADRHGKNVILITQPLVEHHLAKNEADKWQIYKEIIKQHTYSADRIFIKPHPREVTDYRRLADSPIVIIDKEIPLELLEFVYRIPFDRAITLFSSAIEEVGDECEKIVLWKDKTGL